MKDKVIQGACVLSESVVSTRDVRISSMSPDRYDYPTRGIHDDESRQQEKRCRQVSQYVAVKINSVTPVTYELLKSILPTIVALQQPRTVEFISYRSWRESSTDEVRHLRGAILRDKSGHILLYNYGVGLGTEPFDHFSLICRELGISDADKATIEQKGWPKMDYSIVVELL